MDSGATAVDVASAVMLSQATSLKNLAILRRFNPERTLNRFPEDLRDELLRLAGIDTETTKIVRSHLDHVSTQS